MTHSDGSMMTRSGVRIYTQEWRAERPKASVLLVHGLGEHSGRYAHVAAHFNRRGYHLAAFDLPGHGKSVGTRGHIASYPLVTDLISELLAETRRRNPGLPVFLYGHSLGGSYVLYYALTCAAEVEGMIVTSPGLGTRNPVPRWKLALGRVLYKLAPSFTMDNGLDVDGLSHDPAVARAYRDDPLVHPKVSARLGLDLLEIGKWIAGHSEKYPGLPLLLMQGSADPIVDPEKTRRFAESVTGEVSFRMWPGLYHEMHNEPQHGDVLDAMTDWLDRQNAPG